MKIKIILLTLTIATFAQAGQRKPSTVLQFEEASKKEITAKDNVIAYKINAEKFYSLFFPDLDGMMAYYKKLYPHLPTHIKPMVDARERVYKKVLELQKNKKLNPYQVAQNTLSLTPKSQDEFNQNDRQFIALILVETYFKKSESSATEDAWIFRMNMRRAIYPEHEYEVISKYITLFPKGKVAKQKAQYLKDYLEGDYRPMSGDQDIPEFDVNRLMKTIQDVLSGR